MEKWLFKCDCGKVKGVRVSHVKSGNVVSCGCHKNEKAQTHGLSKLREYKVWAAMIARCKNPTNPNYKNYGARGIRVCKRWGKFANFISDMGRRPENGSIDRINNEDGYSPNNCRWATQKEQGRNRRGNHRVLREGKMITIAEASEISGLSATTISHRVSKGVDPTLIFEPPNTMNHNKLSDDVVRAIRASTGTQKEIAQRFGTVQTNVSQILARKSRRNVV